jgi:ankyrin repeat protein
MTALHIALQYGHVSMVQLLIEREADPAIRDDLHHGDTEGAATHFGQIAVRDHWRTIAK